MNATVCLITLVCSTTAHWVCAMIYSLFARHKVQYLCLAWINAIFAFVLTVSCFFCQTIAEGQPGMLHPLMLLVLVASCYLQSIYPLSIPMPGFLQWGRMWRYASPIVVLLALYLVALLVGSRFVILHDFSDIFRNLLSSDLLLRLTALGLSVYYIVNIFRLPRQMTKNPNVPRYLIGYCTVLGLISVFYIVATVIYSPHMILSYVILFTIVNLYLNFRVLETMAIHLPKPVLETVVEEPSEEEVVKAELEDFNEANLRRFNRIQFWMQHHREAWTSNLFNRDILCEAVGYNRHLVLQSVRSQGFNNVHDYINSYRIDYLKSLIRKRQASTLTECLVAGFGTVKTARSCFEKMEGSSLDEFLAACRDEPFECQNATEIASET